MQICLCLCLGLCLCLCSCVDSSGLTTVPASSVKRCVTEEHILSGFIRTFKNAFEGQYLREPKSSVVRFDFEDLSPNFLRKIDDEYRFLMQDEYVRLWNFCASQWQVTYRRQFLVVGTAGLGKSVCRLAFIGLWLTNRMGDLGTTFETVAFNFGNNFFSVDRDCEVRKIVFDIFEMRKHLALFDPCTLLGEMQTLPGRLSMMFTSVSPVIGDMRRQVCLSQCIKDSIIFIMKAPTADEAKLLFGVLDEHRLDMCSWVGKDKIKRCLPRWLERSEMYLSQQFSACLRAGSETALFNWFCHNRAVKSSDPGLPFHLCVIEECSGGAWEVSRFISEEIEAAAMDWARRAQKDRVPDLALILDNPFCRSSQGIFFECWIFRALGEKSTQLKLYHNSIAEYCFNGIRNVECSSLEFDNRVLYKIDKSNFASIGGYSLYENELLLIQTTVGQDHQGARYQNLRSIIEEAQYAGKSFSVTVAYVTLYNTNFRLPSVFDFPVGVAVCWGHASNEQDIGVPLEKLSSQIKSLDGAATMADRKVSYVTGPKELESQTLVNSRLGPQTPFKIFKAK